MKSKVFQSLDEAVADVPDGATIMFGGFGAPGVPRNLIAALLRQGANGLTGISNTPGWPGHAVDVARLIEGGRVRKMVCSFVHASPTLEELIEAGEMELELVPQGTLSERIRAAGAGIGAFYTPTGVGTEAAKGKEHKSISGRDYLLEYPLRADYAFIRAHQADTSGNLQYRLSQRNFGPIMAQAAHTTIVEVEEEFLEPGSMDPDQVNTPGIFVSRMIKIPPAPEGIWDSPVPG